MCRAVREAYEVLTTPPTRHAYDRFGPIALTRCAHLTPSCKTESEYLWRAAFHMFWGHHVAQTAFLVLMWFITPGTEVPQTRRRGCGRLTGACFFTSLVWSSRPASCSGPAPARCSSPDSGDQPRPHPQLEVIAWKLSTTTFVGSSHELSVLFAFATDVADMHLLLSTFDAFARTMRDEARKGFRGAFGPFRRVQDKERREELIRAVKKRWRRWSS
ncbi:hypothetical protein M427DRAFT_56642 [Gonapodya prolifera JEL478]|uniref:J domain-containing protein n=1 Tax=Gonapodya prolifera (strain JEL478) TaxID=1344416 RepID=A0A139AGH3_GONPJ|nr:hypothetical protein M427DRAFT_56642 [Gonapodya prolifera JEL478]|eukprot:KXS15545.1 hypothetical protein M427DRAFT_56642 [Gonapodya prolifera JEL478]